MRRPSSFTDIESVTNADEIKQFSCAEALRNTGRDLVLFTPALLLTHGGFDRDPVMEFDARYELPGSDYRPFVVDLKRDHERFFDGLGLKALPGRTKPVNWDQRLYAIDAEYSGDCFEFIGGICWSDPKINYFAEVMSYDMVIPDPTSKLGETLTVKVFGVLANRLIAYLEDRLGQRPLARCIQNVGGQLPKNLPRTNFLGVVPKFDPLQMRDAD